MVEVDRFISPDPCRLSSRSQTGATLKQPHSNSRRPFLHRLLVASMALYRWRTDNSPHDVGKAEDWGDSRCAPM